MSKLTRSEHKVITLLLGLFAVLALLAASCGNDDDSPADGLSGSELVIGQVMPETGTLAFLSPPMIEGIALAVEDITGAGGNVRLLTADTATDNDVAPEAVNRLLGEGANVIVGAASSGVSQSFIQTLSDAQVPQCSPSNTSPSFTNQANADFYFRTVPPDHVMSLILAGIVAGDGATNVAIVARADDWGNALSQLLVENFNDLGVSSEVVSYDEEASNFDATVARVESLGADAVLMVTYSEGAQIIRGLLEGGIPASAMYGADGIYDTGLAVSVDPSNPNVVDGFVAVTADLAGQSDDFTQRLIALTDGGVAYGGQAYDCVVVLALSTLAAGSVDGPAILAQIQAVTGGGQKCFDYAECASLMADGVDIDYEGVSGPLELDAAGDPTFGSYVVGEFIDGVLTVIDSQDIDLNVLG